VCFEVKRWNNYNNRNKDRINLQILTGGSGHANKLGFGYDYGFYIIFGKTRDKIIIEIYKDGKLLNDTI